MNYNKYPKGSEWAKWDLHVHTPMSVIQHYGGNTEEAWEKYVSDLENLPEEIKVIGVNDYLFIDGYEKLLEYKTNGRLSNIDLLLPMVELRLAQLVGSDETKKINFHVIFSNDITPSIIKEHFLQNLKVKFDFWDNGAVHNEEKLVEFAQLYRKSLTESSLLSTKDKSDKEFGFNNLQYELDDKDNSVLKILENSNFYRNGQPLFFTALGYSEWDSMRWNSAASLKNNIINKTNFVLTASPSIEQFKKNKKTLIEKVAKNDVIHCSDAHDFSDFYYEEINKKLEKNNESKKIRKHRGLGETFTWIKSNPTFEGLRQITFEPEYRIRVQTTKPAEPLYQIKKIDLTFPETTKLVFDKNAENGSHTFCFKGTREISFSPNLTCIIGGRGTGKSTLLGLLEKCIKPNSQPFFEKENLQITNEDKLLKINNCVKVDSNVDTQFIEFISQNEIESFAKNSEALTLALYNRLINHDERENDGVLSTKQLLLTEQIKNLNNIVYKKRELQKQKKELKIKEQELQTHKAKIDYDKSEEYKTISNQISGFQKELTNIEQSKTQYNVLLTRVSEIIKTEVEDTEAQNDYSIAKSEIITKLKEIEQQERVFTHIENRVSALKDSLTEQKLKMNNYLTSKGITDADSKDISNANMQVAKIEQEIFTLKKEIETLENFINSFEFEQVKQSSETYRQELESQITPVSQKLQNISTSTTLVKPITLEYAFDSQMAKSKLFEEFRDLFKTNEELPSKLNSSTIKDALFSISEPFDFIEDSNYKTKLLEQIRSNKDQSDARDALLNLLEIEENFDIFLCLVKKHKWNTFNYKQINVSYDGRSVERTSFGQRCTAALVILLTLGNSPIIIDEPEAHLDSMLISNYLVDVIKQKKQERQIIFATHNANFVVNGDAELIHILEMDENNVTQIISTTIESLDTREKLINLEGGKEAFKKREKKY